MKRLFFSFLPCSCVNCINTQPSAFGAGEYRRREPTSRWEDPPYHYGWFCKLIWCGALRARWYLHCFPRLCLFRDTSANLSHSAALSHWNHLLQTCRGESMSVSEVGECIMWVWERWIVWLFVYELLGMCLRMAATEYDLPYMLSLMPHHIRLLCSFLLSSYDWETGFSLNIINLVK